MYTRIIKNPKTKSQAPTKKAQTKTSFKITDQILR